MRRAAAFARGVALALAVAGCASIYVSSDWDPQADFGHLHAWAWFPQARLTSGDPRLDSGLLDLRIRAAVEAELGARGFTSAEPVSADFLVAYHVALDRKLQATTIDDYYGSAGFRHWSGPGYTQTYVSEVEVGTLMLDVLDARSHELIWRGTAQAEVIADATPEEREARVREAVRRMLERFPPAKASPAGS